MKLRFSFNYGSAWFKRTEFNRITRAEMGLPNTRRELPS